MSQNNRSEFSLPIEFDSRISGIGLPPRLITKFETRYNKIIRIDRSESKYPLAERIVPVPSDYHDRSVVVIPEKWKSSYNITRSSFICKLYEPPFAQKIKLRSVEENETVDLPPITDSIADKAVIFAEKYIRFDDHIYQVTAINEGNTPIGIVTEETDIHYIRISNNTDDDPADDSKDGEDSSGEFEDGFSEGLYDDEDDDDEFSITNLRKAQNNKRKPSLGPVKTSFTNLNKVKGIDDALKRIKDEVIYPFVDLLNGNIKKPKPIGGVLLYGPPGCGKTEIVTSIAQDLDIDFYPLKLGELASKYVHQFAKNLHKAFKKAEQSKKGAIIFLDEIDAIAGHRSEMNNSHEIENVNALLQELDPKNRSSNVLVFAATNYLSSLDTAVTRSGRFDTKIPIPPPDELGRRAILRSKLSTLSTDSRSVTENFVNDIAKKTIGYVGSDLNTVVDKAEKLKASRARYLKQSPSKTPVKKKDINKAIKATTPLCKTEMNIEQPTLVPRDLPGSEDYIEEICEEIEYILSPHKFRQDIEYKANQAFLLHGPPGTGKTSIANAVANINNLLFQVVNAGELKAKYSGETVKNINELFDKARLFRPILLFFDEIDSIAQRRSSSAQAHTSDSINTLLTQFGDNVDNENIIIVAATNRKNIVDEALLREGRIGTHIEVGLPDKSQIKKQFKKGLKEVPSSLTNDEISTLVEKLHENESSQATIAGYLNKVKRYLVFNTKRRTEKADFDTFQQLL
jgi:SpoVK/Ycf46/Vps4 family AAA+-type ATPase